MALVTDLVDNARPFLLLAVASHLEANAIRSAVGAPVPAQSPPRPLVSDTPWSFERIAPNVDLLVTGVGKVNAAAAVATMLEHHRHAGVLSLGIAGILPSAMPPAIGDVVVASSMRYSDEGLDTPDGYRSLSQMGFPHGPFDEGLGLAATPNWSRLLHDRLTALLGDQPAAPTPRVHLGPIATVSTCSGTDALAHQVASRTSALAEAMEGAAACQVAAWHALKFAEVRVLSNTTGDRARQQWDMKGSLAMLGRVAAAICL
jgi:futalosine hydrolase